MVERPAHERIKHKRYKKGQDNHWMKDYLRLCSRYPKDWLKRVYTRLSRIQKNNFMPLHYLFNQNWLLFLP